MKKFTVLIVMLLLCVGSLFAQVPEKFNYQAVVRNASNALVTNAQVGVRVSILQGSAAGNAVYVENHTATTNANGLLTIEIGGGTVLEGNFASIEWNLGQLFLKTEIDPAGASNYTIVSTQQLLSVPYALYAETAGNGFSGDYNDLTNKPTIPQNLGDLTNDAGYVTINDVASLTQTQSDWAQTDTLAMDFIKNKPNLDEMEMKLWEDMDIVPKLDSEYPSHNGYISSSNASWTSSSTYKHWLVPVEHIRKVTITANSNTASYYTFFNSYEEDGSIPTTTYATGYSNTISVPAGTTKEIIVPSDALWMYLNTGNNGVAKADSILLTGIGITEHRGTSSQFVKADGSIDTNAYLTDHQDISGKANIEDLATVAFSGDYNDLANKPIIPGSGGVLVETDPIFSAWDKNYNDLTNKPIIPTVPTNISAFVNDAGYITAIPDSLGGISIESDPVFSAWNKDYNDLTNKPNFAPVATSGSYNDLTNKPTIPADNDLVHITGDETITGSKKVTSDFTVKSTTTSGVTPFLTFQRGTATDSYVDWKINSEGGKLQFFSSTSGTDTKKFDINNTRALFANNVEAAQFIKTGGTSSQFLKADGSVDNNTYLTQHQDISGKANTEDLATVAFSGDYNDLANKPIIPDGSGGVLVETDPVFSAWDKNYNDLTNKPTIPAAQVNSDWNATSGVAKILNKPALAAVATSGSYNDLTNKPTIPAAQVNSDWNATSGVAKILNKPAFAAVATSGNYNDLTNKPTIPADNGLVHIAGDETITGSKKVTSDFIVKSTTTSGVTPFLTFQRGTATDGYVDWKINGNGGALQFFYSMSGDDTKKFEINNTKALFSNNVEAAQFIRTGGTSSQFLKADGSVDNNTYLTQQDISGKANTADLASVAFSGSYNDLANTPTIPAAQVNSDWNATSGMAKILNKPNLSAVATSGSYNDLSNKPTIPSDNNLVHLTGNETITGGKTMTSDLSLKNTGSAGNVTPSLTFQRGTLTDSYTDWKIVGDGGALQFFYSTSGTATKKFDINNTRALFANNVEAAKFVKTGGTSSQFLKADGSVDNNTYLTQQDISGKANTADLASVAFSGNYNDLTNTPTIPTVNNATLTIKQNGTSLGTFTANQSTNKTINITTLTADDVQAMINDALSEMQQQMDSLQDELSNLQDAVSVMPQTYLVPTSGSKSVTIDERVDHVDVYDWGGPDGNYEDSSNGSLTLVTSDANKVFKITGSYKIEKNWDYLVLYNGSSTNESNTIVFLSDTNGTITTPIYSTGDAITIFFHSDGTVNKKGFALSIDIVSKPSCTVAKAVDVEGNFYNTVQIGNQCWMKENLRTQYYPDHNLIGSGGSNSSSTTGYYYNYSSSSLTLEQRGYLYNWAAVMHGASSSSANPSGVQGICPSGWHVPSDAEWTQLKNYVGSVSSYQCSGSSTYIAKALASTTGWTYYNPYNYSCAVCNNQTSNNATGFNAYPAGYWNNAFYDSGESTYFWSSTVSSGSNTKVQIIYNDDSLVYSSTSSNSYGRSVRCVRNE